MPLSIVYLLFFVSVASAAWPAARRAAVSLYRAAVSPWGVPTTAKLWLCTVTPRIVRRERQIFISGAAVLVLIVSFPAFSGFFFAEDFTYLGLYRSAGNHFWQGIFTPIGGTFIRPAMAAWYLLFNTFLPVIPLAHHIRNWLMTIVAAALLYELMRRLVPDPLARAVGLSIFAISKVHLTTIGYINCNDSIMSLIQTEAAVYFLIVHFQTRRVLFLYLCYAAYTLEVFSRDYGAVIGAIMAAVIFLQAAAERLRLRWVTAQLVPFIGISLLYVLIRVAILGNPFASHSSGSAYHLGFNWLPIAYRIWLFGGNIFNVSLSEIQVTGSGSFATLLHIVAPGVVRSTRPLDIAFVFAAAALLAGSLAVAVWRDKRLWLPVVWIAVFIAPTFLIQNIQIYYILEPVGGLALLVSMIFGNLSNLAWKNLWIALLAAMAVNSAIESRFVNVYSWRFCANAAQRAYVEAIRPHLGQHLRSWTLMVPDARQMDFWSYTLTANDSCPMIPALLRQPGLQAKVVLQRELTKQELLATDAPVYAVANENLYRVGASVVLPLTATGAETNVRPSGTAAASQATANLAK